MDEPVQQEMDEPVTDLAEGFEPEEPTDTAEAEQPVPIHRGHPAPEAGVAPTEQSTDVVEGPPPATYAELTGPEIADLTARSTAIDETVAEANRLAKEADRMRNLAQYGQEALSARVNALITSKDLDPRFQYRIDLRRGAVVPVQR